jgi:hypothetical protein
MYQNLGIHWASSIPAFLALACVPFPFMFYKYGDKIRMKCRYAAEAAKMLQGMRGGDGNERREDEDEEETEGMDPQKTGSEVGDGGEKDGGEEKRVG